MTAHAGEDVSANKKTREAPSILTVTRSSSTSTTRSPRRSMLGSRSLREICGGRDRRKPQTRAKRPTPIRLLMRVFARVRWPSRDMKESGRTVQIGFAKPFPRFYGHFCGHPEQDDPGADRQGSLTSAS